MWAEERAGRRVAGLVARLLCERLPALLAIYAPNAASPEVTTAAQLVQTSIVAVATRAPLLGQPTRATATSAINQRYCYSLPLQLELLPLQLEPLPLLLELLRRQRELLLDRQLQPAPVKRQVLSQEH